MNKVLLIGRLTSAPTIGGAGNGSYARFTLAIDRPYTDANNQRITDFIPCVAFRGSADYISKYYEKGLLVSVEGLLQSSRMTNKDGEAITTYSVIIDRTSPLESKAATQLRRNSNSQEFNIPNTGEIKTNNSKKSNSNNDEANNSFNDLEWDE